MTLLLPKLGYVSSNRSVTEIGVLLAFIAELPPYFWFFVLRRKWLYLSASPRSRMSASSMDLDIAELDLRKLRRLAKAMNLEEGSKVWFDRRLSQGAPSVVKRNIKRDGQVRK